jgi:hypothetical protein
MQLEGVLHTCLGAVCSGLHLNDDDDDDINLRPGAW